MTSGPGRLELLYWTLPPDSSNVCIYTSLSTGCGRDESIAKVSTVSSLSDVQLGQQGCDQCWIIKPCQPPKLTPSYLSNEVMGCRVLIGSESCWGHQMTVSCENSQDRDGHLLLLTWNREKRWWQDLSRHDHDRNKGSNIQQACSNTCHCWSKQWHYL